MAQFSSLEQMQNMSKSMTLLRSYAMMGKHITASVHDPDVREVSGTVQSVTVENGVPYVHTERDSAPAESVTEVTEAEKGQ
jgi:flagellar hook assembly protein FlgD